MYFTPKEWLQLLAIAGAILVFLGGPLWLLLRASRRFMQRKRAEVIANPLVSFAIDVALATQFRQWQIQRQNQSRKAMWPRLLKIGFWLTLILVAGLGAIGLARDKLVDGILVGLALSGIIMGCAAAGVGVVALASMASVRRLERAIPGATTAYLSVEGVVFEPGGYQPVVGTLCQVGWHNGSPAVVELVSRSINSKGGHTYRFSHAPVPPEQVQRVNAAIAPLKELANKNRR